MVDAVGIELPVDLLITMGSDVLCPATLWRFCDFGAVRSSVLTYLLTYLLIYLLRHGMSSSSSCMSIAMTSIIDIAPTSQFKLNISVDIMNHDGKNSITIGTLALCG